MGTPKRTEKKRIKWWFLLSWHKTPALNTQNIHRTLPMKKYSYKTVYFIEILRCTCLELKFVRFYFISVYCCTKCILRWCDDRKSISELSSYHQKWKAVVRICCFCWLRNNIWDVMVKQSNGFFFVLLIFYYLIVLGV